MEGALQQYDGLLCPAAPTVAYRFGVSVAVQHHIRACVTPFVCVYV